MAILSSLLAPIITLLLCFTPKKLWITVWTLPYTLQQMKIVTLIVVRAFIDLVLIGYTVPKKFRQIAKENPNKIAIHFEDRKWTFGEVDDLSNRVAQYFKAEGLKKGDSVALLLDNCPEYICVWLGLAKLGVVTALINTNLKSKDSLAHAIKAGKSTKIIYGSRFQALILSTKSVMPELKLYQFNDNQENTKIPAETVNLKAVIANASNSSVDKDIDAVKRDDQLFFIYTSGTTGLPKATFIRNLRYYMAFICLHVTIPLQKEDCIYDVVPLYHTLGSLMGVSQCVLGGSSVVIRKKFSATNFWNDLEKYKCTASLYIGEMIRYVLAAERNSKKRSTYKLKKLFGVGLNSAAWTELNDILNVEHVYEFYGSTEANFALCNLVNKVGACGFMPIIFDPFNPITIVKCTEDGTPIRNAKGFCQEVEIDEPGLVLCRILPVLNFEGYSDAKATSKKILENVYKTNDRYYNSGDIMSKDEMGFVYFKDRTGDTFRWKGENVSTTEVENMLVSVTKRDITIYGIEIPGNEGKAGMAAVVDKEKTFDLQEFLIQCQSNLPSYSIPIFVRIVEEIPMTGTFKIQKVLLVKEGYDINTVKDALYVLDTKKSSYVKLTPEIHKAIQEKNFRV